MLLHFFFSCLETVYIVWRLSVPSKFERTIKPRVSPSSEGETSATSQFLYIPLESAWEPNPAVGQESAEMCAPVIDASSHLTGITNSPLESGACLKLKLSVWYLLNSRAELARPQLYNWSCFWSSVPLDVCSNLIWDQLSCNKHQEVRLVVGRTGLDPSSLQLAGIHQKEFRNCKQPNRLRLVFSQ